MILNADNRPDLIKECPVCGHALHFMGERKQYGYTTVSGVCGADPPRRESSKGHLDVWVQKNHFYFRHEQNIPPPSNKWPIRSVNKTSWHLKPIGSCSWDPLVIEFDHLDMTTTYKWWEMKGRKKVPHDFQIKGWHLPPVYKVEAIDDIRKWIRRRVLLT